MKGKIYLKQQLLKDIFEVKRHSKGLLVQIKEEQKYKILIDRAFTEHHKKFNTRWGTIYNRFSRIYKKGGIRNVP